MPPGTSKIPSRARLHDIQINIQAFIANVYGATDNLAWVWVHERELADKIPGNHVGFRESNKEVSSSLPSKFHDYLKTLDQWMKYVIEYRDALAIPLYIPPGGVPKKNVDAYNDLARRMNDSLRVRGDGFEYEQLSAEQSLLLVFQPLITHSIRETTAHFAFHVQMLADFATVEDIAYKMLDEL